ncbi:MAG TPA: ThuA domain-containing protein [Acidobacteriaceae bacterium]|nr:ThuA domain-containing protein [Acidobacteriaceae bacterium]
MKRLTRLFAIAAAGLFLLPASFPAMAQARGDRPGAKSIRTSVDNAQIRVSVDVVLGWRVGIFSGVFPNVTFFESAELADALGLATIAGDNDHNVSPEISKPLDYHLSAEEIAAVKARLHDLRLTMPAYRVNQLPADEASIGQLLAFAKGLGVETVIVPAPSDQSSFATLDRLASSNGINVAIESIDPPAALMSSIGSLSPHIGVAADLAGWMENGIRPSDGLAEIKDRLMAVDLRERDGLGPGGRDVPLGAGAGDLEKFFMEIAQQEPPPQEHPNACVNCRRPFSGNKPLFIGLDADPWSPAGAGGGKFDILWQDAANFEQLVRPAMGYRIEVDSRLLPPTTPDRIPADVKAKIEAALPRKALVPPKKPRKLLVIDLNPVGAFYHDTTAHTNFALQKMADYTGAFQPIFSNDLNNLKYPNILQYDAVFLNSGDGEVFSDPEVMNGLIRFVREGGGLAGLHGSSYDSPDIPEFGELIGAQTGPHRVETDTLKIDDPGSPLMRQFADSPLTKDFGGKGFVYTDEFYHFLPSGPYSRKKLHVLLSIDAQRTDLSAWKVRQDNDYGLAWIKSYGQGRVFNCALGHTPTFFETPALAQMMLNAIQFVVGDLPADTTPSALLAAQK